MAEPGLILVTGAGGGVGGVGGKVVALVRRELLPRCRLRCSLNQFCLASTGCWLQWLLRPICWLSA
jgi:hypothetical protein